MPVAIEMRFKGGTLDQYDQVIELMNLHPGGHGPPGALFHWCAQSDGELLVTDVWKSREEFDAFAQEQIGPYTQQVGLPGPPEMKFHDVHSYMDAA